MSRILNLREKVQLGMIQEERRGEDLKLQVATRQSSDGSEDR